MLKVGIQIVIPKDKLLHWIEWRCGGEFLLQYSSDLTCLESSYRSEFLKRVLKIKIKKVEGRLYLRSTFKNLLRLFRRNALRHADHYVLIQWG